MRGGREERRGGRAGRAGDAFRRCVVSRRRRRRDGPFGDGFRSGFRASKCVSAKRNTKSRLGVRARRRGRAHRARPDGPRRRDANARGVSENRRRDARRRRRDYILIRRRRRRRRRRSPSLRSLRSQACGDAPRVRARRNDARAHRARRRPKRAERVGARRRKSRRRARRRRRRRLVGRRHAPGDARRRRRRGRSRLEGD